MTFFYLSLFQNNNRTSIGDWLMKTNWHIVGNRWVLALWLLLLLGFAPVPASGAGILDLDFNQDGIFPSSVPGIVYSTSGLAESSVYSVSGGMLHQRTAGLLGGESYTMNGVLDPTLDTLMETNAKIFRIEGEAGALFQAYDGAYRYSLFFTPSGATLLTAEGSLDIAFDVFQSHTYRLESPGNSSSLRLFLDGDLKATVSAPSFSGNGLEWGDGVYEGSGADVAWDYIRVSQVPEPANIIMCIGSLIALGCAAVWRRRKHCIV